MSTSLTYIGHGTFLIETESTSLLIDPFITSNPATELNAKDVAPEVMLISHGHEDHIGDVIEIASRTNALVISNFEISTWLQAHGLTNCHAMHIGGAKQFDWGRVKLTIAHHGSMLPNGANGGNPCGFLLTLPDVTIYHACDTGLFYDMKLIGEAGVDIAILPIGDNFTMGPEDSIRATQLIEPRRVIPSHYNTFPVIEQDPQQWAHRIREATTAEPVVLAPGETMNI